MLISQTILALRQDDLLQSCLETLEKCSAAAAEAETFIAGWKKSEVPAADDIRLITAAFYEYMKNEAVRVIILCSSTYWIENGGKKLAEDFINLLIPQDTADRIEAKFMKQEMLARASYILDATALTMLECCDEEDCSYSSIDLHKVTTPVDSPKTFMQFINNHIADGNWLKTCCMRSLKTGPERQKTLLEIEYFQCQYTPGEPEYTVWENKYRRINAQINAEYNFNRKRYNANNSTWMTREALKDSVSIPVSAKKEKNRWTWKKYCVIKKELSGKVSDAAAGVFSIRHLKQKNQLLKERLLQ